MKSDPYSASNIVEYKSNELCEQPSSNVFQVTDHVSSAATLITICHLEFLGARHRISQMGQQLLKRIHFRTLLLHLFKQSGILW